jgi:hypothetical protein
MAFITRTRALRYFIIAIAAWLALALITYLALPSYIRNLAITQTEAQIGRKLEIGKVNFNLFTLTVTADDIVLYEPDQTTPAFSLASLTANASITSVLRLSPVLDKLTLVTPKAHIVRTSSQDSGTYNFSDILERIAAMPPSEGKTEFAIGNIEIKQGDIQFDDKVTGKSIHVDTLEVGIPYISNFSSSINTDVQPKLSANINGTPFALAGRSKPFSDTQETVLAIDIEQLDIVSYLPFVPAKLPVQLQSAILTTKLDLSFNQKDAHPEITLSGDIIADKVAVADNSKQPLFKTERAAVTLNNFNVINLAGTIDAINIQSPQVWAALDAKGNMNWVQAFANNPASPSKTTPAKSDTTDTPSTPPAITVQHLVVGNGTVYWRDQANAKPRLETTLSQLNIDAKGISTIADAPAGTVTLSATEGKTGQLNFNGTVQAATSTVAGQVSLQSIALTNYQPYVNPYLNATVSGNLSAQVGVNLKDGQFTVSDANATIDDLKLATKQAGAITIKQIAATNGNADIAARTAHLDTFRISGLNGDIRRNKDGQLNLTALLHHQTNAPSPAPAKSTTDKSTPWVATLGNAIIDQSSVRYQDESLGERQSVQVSAINIKLDKLSTQMNTASQFSVDANIDKQGKLSITGQSTAGLKQVNLNVNARNIPVAPWQSFFTEYVNITLPRGSISAKGKVALVPPLEDRRFALNYQGDVALSNFRILDKLTASDFLRWRNIDLNTIHVDIGKASPNISVGKIALSNFFARAVLSDKGRLNLQDIIVSEDANKAEDKPAEKQSNASVTVAKTTTSTEAVTKTEQATNAPHIRIGQIVMQGGNINFTDNFIKPNYRANMTALNGTIGTITSDKIDPASVDIKGKIDDDAPLVISGAVNPLFKPLFIDIKASAHGIEMTRLTPYSTKYAGYPIEKGKLSMDVSYKIEDQKLVAENSLRIDQLTFGEFIDGPDATKLPVMLAVALLRDSDGTINVDLPVSGSLSDPQFSIGGVIVRVFINLIVKAVTSPFALIGSMFNSSEQLDNVPFAVGSAALNPDIIKRMDMINTAMVDRPALKLDIIGRADPKLDEAGIAEERLYRQMRQLKRQSLPTAERNTNAEITLTQQEEVKFLTEIYKKAKFDKPTNAIGFAKSLPPEEMKALIISNTTVSKDDLQTLAMQRADTIRNYMQREGNIPAERIFLVAPKLANEGIKGAENGARVDFSLK